MTNIIKQLEQELQNELITSNHLLRLISQEIQQIKEFTSPGGEFEASIKQNASLVSALASIQQIDIENLPPIRRSHVEPHQTNDNMSYEQHDSFREQSNMNHRQ